MSVPPEMDATWRSCLMWRYTKSKLSGASGEPVEVIVFNVVSRCVFIGDNPALLTASMNLAEVPKRVIPVSSARSNRTLPLGYKGEPSYSSSVASDASAVTSQFHIIHPHVVK